jgi:hypothetical protein
MFSEAEVKTISEAAGSAGLEAAALLAVAEVESGGKTFALVAGRREPLIRFEGHYFDRRLSAAERAIARREGLSSSRPGVIANPASQSARWRLLARAKAINARAACESVSWGVGQVMGAHWARLEFPSIDALVAEARSGLEGELRLMLRYIDKAGLRESLQARDWSSFARGYNGPAYRRNRYDEKLAVAYTRYSAMDAPASRPSVQKPSVQEAGALRRGSRGPSVAELQALLTAAGCPTMQDGVFGPATEQAVRLFQTSRGLAADGVAGPSTISALRRSQEPPSICPPLWRRIVLFLRRWLDAD